MNGYADNLNFSIEGVSRSVSNLRDQNEQNKQNKEKFLDYIESSLVPVWTTDQGKVAINELKTFVEEKFTDYIQYLDRRIDALEFEVVPRLKKINQA